MTSNGSRESVLIGITYHMNLVIFNIVHISGNLAILLTFYKKQKKIKNKNENMLV